MKNSCLLFLFIVKTAKRILQAALLGYFLLVLYSTVNIPSFFIKTSHEKYNYSKKFDVIRELCEKHNAILLNDSVSSYSPEYQDEVLRNNVILDSTIIGIEKEGGSYFVKVDLGADRHGRIFAKLKCNKKMYNMFNEFHFKDALLLASINQISISDSLNYIRKGESDILAETGADILLAGDCLDAVELAAF